MRVGLAHRHMCAGQTSNVLLGSWQMFLKTELYLYRQCVLRKWENFVEFFDLFSTVLSALGARKVSTKCPKWKFLPRALYARAFSFRASRTRALRTDWTSSVSYSLQTGAQHAEESKDSKTLTDRGRGDRKIVKK